MSRRHRGGYSSSWIYPTTRLAIYLRDGLGCVYCDVDWSCSNGFTVDHILPRTKGGKNDPTNLVTSCRRCNNLRRHIRASPLFNIDEWGALATALHSPEKLYEKALQHAAVPLATFRLRARKLRLDRPQWLKDLKRISVTHPGDGRVRAEESETPQELLALMPRSNDDIPF